MLHRARQLGVMVLLVAFIAGCSAKAFRINAALTSEQLALSTERLQNTVISYHAVGLVDQPSFEQWQHRFGQMAEAGLLFNAALRLADSSAALSQIDTLLAILDSITAEQIVKIPEDKQLAVLIIVESIRASLLTIKASVGAV